jgi:hypothetical protein
LNNSQAEEKPFKVGESVTDNADGNTEPSRLENSNQACVESRQKVCIKCNNVITNKRSKKYCSAKCRSAYIAYQFCLRKGKFDKPGVGSGGNQKGVKNHQYKTGIGMYNKIAFSNKPHTCERCNSTSNLLVHHIDHNRSNNELHNLEVLCKRCHQKHHEQRDSLGRYTKVYSGPV